MSLFGDSMHIPLAKRCAPKDFSQYEGQKHLVGPNKAISMMAEKKIVQSMILYGPPASGKTGLVRIIADLIDAECITANALTLSSDDIKQITQKAQINANVSKKTVLFIDEIHRLTRPKQDVFLNPMESGLIILIGATTENPYFALQPALRSRILILELFPLPKEDLKKILNRAIAEDSLLKELNVSIEEDAAESLVQFASDPRNMLTILETVVLSKSIGDYNVTKDDIINIIQKKDAVYDNESGHYDVISAFIKSIRGSDPDASLYYLALMIDSGEDPRFIFRRLLISAVEDVGLAYPEAITIVQSCADAFERIGFPEGNLLLSHATLLLAGLPKSNSVLSINNAIASIRAGNIYAIPPAIRDNHYSGAEKLGRGIDYKYPHDFPENFVEQEYTSTPVSFYNPQDSGFEKKLKERLNKLWKKRYP